MDSVEEQLCSRASTAELWSELATGNYYWLAHWSGRAGQGSQLWLAVAKGPGAEILAKQLIIYRRRQKDTLGILFILKRFQL
jgi:hypothetical protein